MRTQRLQLLLTNKKFRNAKDDCFVLREENQELDFDVALWMMQESAKQDIKMLDLSGEPLLYSKIKLLLKEAKKIGYFIKIETNGKLFLKNMFWLRETGVDLISISFAGVAVEVHDFIRGQYAYWEDLAAVEAAKNLGFKLEVQYIFGRHNIFEGREIFDFMQSLKADFLKIKEILPFGSVSENKLALSVKEAERYYTEIGSDLERTKIPFVFNYEKLPYRGSWTCNSLQAKDIVCNWNNKVGHCFLSMSDYIIDKNNLNEGQFERILDVLDERINKFLNENKNWQGSCERCLNKKKSYFKSTGGNYEINFSRNNHQIESKNIETLEVDITNQGRLNDIFYKDKEKRQINGKILFDFFDKISGQLTIKNVLLRGMGEPINHPHFFSIVEYFVKHQKPINIFIFPEEIEKYIKILNFLLPKVSLSVYHYPTDNYDKVLSKLSQFKKNIAGHFYIVDNESYSQTGTFLKYASENIFSPLFIRVMSQNSHLDSSKKTDLENIIKTKNLHRNIFWENGRDFNCQCSYLRGQRMFVNSRGNISFCHFLPQAEKPEVALSGIENNIEHIADLYNKFKEKKEAVCQRGDYCFDIDNPSPCDYCYRYVAKIIDK